MFHSFMQCNDCLRSSKREENKMSHLTMKKLIRFSGLILTLLISSCSLIYDKHVQWEQVEPESYPVLTAIGYAPISLQKAEHETQRMLMAISASKIAAYAELTEQVYGQKIDGQVTVENLILQNKTLSSSVNGIIRGAKVTKSYPLGDTYATELSLDFKDVYEIYTSTMPQKEIKSVKYY